MKFEVMWFCESVRIVSVVLCGVMECDTPAWPGCQGAWGRVVAVRSGEGLAMQTFACFSEKHSGLAMLGL